MRVKPGGLPGLMIVEPEVFGDDRGYFMETYHERKLAAQGLFVRFVQDNYSRSVRDTLRGLHYQHPSGQGKLVRATAGAIFDVAVDIRVGSPTFGKWAGHEISSDNKLALYVPVGFAHGFCVLSEAAEVSYKCTDFYAPSCERGIAWNDPDIGIEWPVKAPLLSGRDSRLAPLAEQREFLPPFE